MTTYTYVPKDKIHIPKDWTGEQAKAVWEFLEEICTAIWDVHDLKLLDAFQKEESLLERSASADDRLIDDDHFEDDIPF
jgi:hypothetical protein